MACLQQSPVHRALASGPTSTGTIPQCGMQNSDNGDGGLLAIATMLMLSNDSSHNVGCNEDGGGSDAKDGSAAHLVTGPVNP